MFTTWLLPLSADDANNLQCRWVGCLRLRSFRVGLDQVSGCTIWLREAGRLDGIHPERGARLGRPLPAAC